MFINKIISLAHHFYRQYSCAKFYIERIEQIEKTNDFLLYFVNIENKNVSTVNVSCIFSDKLFLNKFSSHDASKIGYYAAKLILKSNIYE